MNRRFLIASGGTGGHFYPGFALGKTLRKQGCAVLFIVRKNDSAIQTLEDNKLHYREIDFIGFPRSINPVRHIRFWIKFIKSLLQTRQIVRDFHPDAVLGTGGYISFPLILVAHIMGIKTAIHDSNSRIGLANRLCSWWSNLFMIGLPLVTPRQGTVLTSTPIRPEFAEPVDRKALLRQFGLDPSMPTTLVVGGSQGAKNLNIAVVQTAQKYTDWQFIHITGERWFSTVKEMHNKNPRVAVLSYNHEIYALMKAVDLIICRSGASTLAELIYCQLPAILVPFPHAAANHQYYNAKILTDAGCALMVTDNETLVHTLENALGCVAPLQTRETMRQCYLKLNIPNPITAAEHMARLLNGL